MDSKEDDGISIDFSKIKNFFKARKQEEKPKEHEQKIHSDSQHEKKEDETIKQKKEDEELSFDFSKIKKFFNGKKFKKTRKKIS